MFRMEALTDFICDVSSMDIIVTVICGQHGIADSLKLQGINESVLPDVSENYNRKSAQILEIKHLEDVETHSYTEPRLTGPSESQEICNSSDEEFDTGGSDRTCTCLALNVSMDPMLASCLTTELRRSRSFGTSFRRALLKSVETQAVGGHNRFRIYQANKKMEDRKEICGNVHLHLRLRLSRTWKYFRMEPDIRWSNRMLPLWVQRIQMEEAFSWLSTLGGAYSSLGDNMYNCALEAGRVAIQQLYIAERLGDATLRSRCLLYVALSLMQRGQLAKAKRLVRQQYKFATSKAECLDTRLVCMCHGIWHHLRHHYAKRKET